MNQFIADGLKILLTISLCGACKNDGTASDKPPSQAKPTESAASAETPIVLSQTLDLGGAITDPSITAYKGLKAKAPAGATAEAGLVGLVVKTGKNEYEISKELEPLGYVAKVKSEAQTDEFEKLVKIHIETPNVLVWETKPAGGDDHNFHFAATVAVGGTTYQCANLGHGQFTRAEVDAQLKGCQSLTK